VPTAVVLTACVDVWSTVVSRWQRRWHVGAVARGVVLTVLASSALADDAVVADGADGAVGAQRAPKLCVDWWGVDRWPPPPRPWVVVVVTRGDALGLL